MLIIAHWFVDGFHTIEFCFIMTFSTSRAIRSCVTLVALVVVRHNVHQTTLTTSNERHLLVESSAQVIAASGVPSSLPPQEEVVEIRQEEEQQYDLYAFLPENLRRLKRVQCGFYKCFFRLRHNDDMGYLVSSEYALRKQLGKHWQPNGAWYFAEYMHQKYGIHNTLMEPATNTTVTPELALALNRNLWVVGHGKVKKKKRYKEGSTIILQKVQTVPKPNLLFAVLGKKLVTFYNEIESFISGMVQDKQEFGNKFLASMTKARTIVQQEPCFAYDFQVLLDVHGNFYHLDYERCLQPSNRYDVNNTLQIMSHVEELVQQVLANLTMIS